MGDFAIMLRRSQNALGRKAISKDKFFNCHKMEHFKRDYIILDIYSIKKKAKNRN